MVSAIPTHVVIMIITHIQEELRQQQLEGRTIKARIHAHKMATVRTKRYYRDYELRLKAKMQRKRTREEQVGQRIKKVRYALI